MRNEQEFKALVMQKVREQKYQKQAGLQKIRAVTASLCAVALVVIGVVSVVWFINANPSTDYSSQDGPYGGPGAQSFWNRFFSHNYSGDDAGDENRGETMNVSPSTNCDQENSDANSKTDYSLNESHKADSSNEDSLTSPSPDDFDATAGQSEDNGNGGSVDSEGYSPESDSSNSHDSEINNSGVATESVSVRMTLEGLNEATSSMLALKNGYTEDEQATAAIFSILDRCIETPTLTEPNKLLFTLREGDALKFSFYDNNIMSLSQNGDEQFYEFSSDIFQSLLLTLQNTEFIPIS